MSLVWLSVECDEKVWIEFFVELLVLDDLCLLILLE